MSESTISPCTAGHQRLVIAVIQDTLSIHAQRIENPNVKTAGITNTASAINRPKMAPGISRLAVLANSKAAMASNRFTSLPILIQLLWQYTERVRSADDMAAQSKQLARDLLDELDKPAGDEREACEALDLFFRRTGQVKPDPLQLAIEELAQRIEQMPPGVTAFEDIEVPLTLTNRKAVLRFAPSPLKPDRRFLDLACGARADLAVRHNGWKAAPATNCSHIFADRRWPRRFIPRRANLSIAWTVTGWLEGSGTNGRFRHPHFYYQNDRPGRSPAGRPNPAASVAGMSSTCIESLLGSGTPPAKIANAPGQ